MKVKFLVASDLHLSDRIWRHRPIEGDSYFSWKQIVDNAIAAKVHGVILAGDILDKQANLSGPVQALVRGLERLRDAGISVYYNQGQHEYQHNPWAGLVNGVTWLHDQTIVTESGWRIAGCDYQNEENLQAFLAGEQARQADILVCHQVWREFMGEVGKPQGAFTDVPENVQCLITGDFHEHICQRHGELTVLSPGSTHMRSIAEPEDHSVFLLTLEAPPEFLVRSVPIYSRRCLKLNSKGVPYADLRERTERMLAEAAEYAAAHLPSELQMPLVQLTHPRQDEEIVRKWQQEFHDQAHLFFKQLNDNVATDNEERSTELNGTDSVGMIGLLHQFLDPEEDAKKFNLALALIQSPDCEQALLRWVADEKPE